MCSLLSETRCSVCYRTLDKSTNRIIVEICGHQKCRECFIKEEEGCSICKATKQSLTIDENVPEKCTEIQENLDDSKSDVESSIGKASHIITVNEDGTSLLYKCTICQKTFKAKNNRNYHLFCDKSRSKPFHCEICNKQFITLAHFKYHQSTHEEKRFSCQHCNRIYSGEIALKKHLRKHQNDFKYECDQCNEKFIYKEQLNIHLNRHNDVFHSCNECGKRFLIKSNYTKHLQAHSGTNRKSCSVCGNTFSGSSALKTHLLTHSNTKTHQCDRCEKKFIDHRTLERHQKTHSDEIVYECTLCTAKSNRKDNIRRHVRNLHSNTDDELKTILTKIFDNFSSKQNQKFEKTDKNGASTATTSGSVDLETVTILENNETTNVPKNNTTSVIKFAGRMNQQKECLIDLRADENRSIEPNQRNDTPKVKVSVPVTPTEIESYDVEEIAINLDPISEIETELPSLNCEPLSFDAFPAIAPLPRINTNTNLNVYRQLLSPYLKKSTSSVDKDKDSTSTRSQTTMNEPKAALVIDRPPKKMIEKYEIYRQ